MAHQSAKESGGKIFFSARPPRALRLGGELAPKNIDRGDAEDAENAQSSFSGRLLKRAGSRLFQLRVGKMQTTTSIRSGHPADRRILVDGLTLMALGLSVLFLNSWNTLFVRTAIGLFWGTFFLISNWTGLVQTFQGLRQKNDAQRRSSYRSST